MWVNKTITKTVSNPSTSDADSYISLIISELSEIDGITAVSGENAVIIKNKLKLAIPSNQITMATLEVSIGAQSFGSQSINITNGTSGSRTFTLNFHIAVSADEKVISIKIKNYATATTSGSLNFNDDILWAKTDGNTEIISWTHVNSTSASSTRTFATSQALTRVSDQQAVFTAQSRIPYTNDSDSTKLDTITGKVLTTGGIRSDVIGSMLDSSYIAGDALYPSGDKQYYSVDDYSLIEI